MARTILKHELDPTSFTCEVQMHRGSELLSVGAQMHISPSAVMCWVLADREAPLVTRRLHMVATGEGAPEEPFVGTARVGKFVWHVFDAGEVEG